MFSLDDSIVTAILTALFVTVLWSTSWILVKVGLNEIPPHAFAGLRYVWAFLVLPPVHATRFIETKKGMPEGTG